MSERSGGSSQNKSKPGDSSERKTLHTVLTKKKGRRHESTRLKFLKSTVGPPPPTPPPSTPTVNTYRGLPSRLNRLSSPPPASQATFPSSDFDDSSPFDFAEMDDEDDVADLNVVEDNIRPAKRIRVSQ